MTRIETILPNRLRRLARRGGSPNEREPMSERHARHPALVEAVLGDVRTHAAYRGHPIGPGRRDALVAALRLVVVGDAFGAQVLYRIRTRLLARGVPFFPSVLHHLSIRWGQVCIGDPVVIRPGLYLPHGQVVIDGLTEIGSGVIVTPFVTIGLTSGEFIGPTIGNGVHVGTGARLLGAITVGDRATIGANAVVVDDVEPMTTVVGVPARPLHDAP